MSQPQPIGVNTSAIKKGSGNGQAAAPTIAIRGVTGPNAVNVIYNAKAPAQGNPPSTGIVDLALDQDGNAAKKNGSLDVIASLAKDLLAGKSGKA
jgi:hypothetical protein